MTRSIVWGAIMRGVKHRLARVAMALLAGFAGVAGAAAQAQEQPIEGRGYFGAGVIAVTPEVLKRTGINPGEGAQVAQLLPGGPALQAGVRVGDVILAVDGKPVVPDSFVAGMQTRKAGGSVTIDLARDAKRLNVTAVLSASRFQVLQPKVNVDSDNRVQPFDNPAASLRCFTINTQPGQMLKIMVWQKAVDYQYLPMSMSTSDACDPKNAIDEFTPGKTEVMGSYYVTTRTMVAGGGPYTLMVVADRNKGFKDYSAYYEVTGTQSSNWAPTRLQQAMGSQATLGTASTAGKGGSPYQAGQSFSDCDAPCPTMVVIPKGNFLMGSASSEADRNGDEGPAHKVVFAMPFAMAARETSFDEWNACVADGACASKAQYGAGKRPVTNVGWAEARAYAEWLSKKSGQAYFLPSEAEWEYAARAGTTTPWNTGDAIVTDDANILNTYKQTVPTGGFPANAFGVFDVHGNVWEWTLDCHDVGYFGVPKDGGAATTPGCPNRVARGGGFDSPPAAVRSAMRWGAPVGTSTSVLGFRVARAM